MKCQGRTASGTGLFSQLLNFSLTGLFNCGLLANLYNGHVIWNHGGVAASHWDLLIVHNNPCQQTP
jgi:hypothetical protein